MACRVLPCLGLTLLELSCLVLSCLDLWVVVSFVFRLLRVLSVGSRISGLLDFGILGLFGLFCIRGAYTRPLNVLETVLV